MHICLATDVKVDSIKNGVQETGPYFSENILSSIKIYLDGLVEVSPALSSILDEPATDQPVNQDDFWADPQQTEGVALSAFLSDRTAEAALKKGFRLSTFRTRAANGTEYEYVVQNVNELLIPHKLEEIARRKALQDAVIAAENRGSLPKPAAAKEDESQPLSEKEAKSSMTVSVYGEVVSGSGFEGDSLYVNYQVRLPPRGWTLRSSPHVADVDSVATSATAAGSAEDSESASHSDPKGLLAGTTHTATTVCASQISTAAVSSFGFSRGTRLILGVGFFILSGLTVMFGASYPFWVPTALIILCVVGTGTSAGIPLAASSQSTTAPSAKRAVQTCPIEAGHLAESVAIFNHLINFSCSVSEEDMRKEIGSLASPSAFLPVIMFQVYSVGSNPLISFDRHRLEGYGFVPIPVVVNSAGTQKLAGSSQYCFDLPLQSGSNDLALRTWKPKGGIKSKTNEFFLSNNDHLKDPAFVEVLNKADISAVNKFGVLTESSGTVRIRFQCVVTDPQLVPRERPVGVEERQETNNNKIKRTVDDILNSFKSSLSVSKGSRSDLSTGRKPSVPSIMQTLDTASKASRVADLLAKVRGSKATSPSLSAASSTDRLLSSPLMQRRKAHEDSPAIGRTKLGAPATPRLAAPAGIAERDAEASEDSAERTPLLRPTPPSSSSPLAADRPIMGSKLVRKTNETANIPRNTRYRNAEQEQLADSLDRDSAAETTALLQDH